MSGTSAACSLSGAQTGRSRPHRPVTSHRTVKQPQWEAVRPYFCRNASRRGEVPGRKPAHHAEELVKEVRRLPGSGTGFGVVLHGDDRQARVAEAGDRLVVDVLV